jgi:ubiquinone/menaquinone biosynthesis C-methylase UbiE
MSDSSASNTSKKKREHQLAVSSAFGSIAPLYDSWYESPLGRYVWSVETYAVEALLPHQVHCVALEVGVGTGMALPLLQDTALQLIGIDIAWQMLGMAHQKTDIQDNVHLVLADGAWLPIRQESTEIVLGMTVLEFVADRDEFLQEIHRCLRPGGNLLLGVLTSTNLWALERQIRNIAQPDIFELARFLSPWQVRRLLYQNGFSQTKYRGSVYAPPFSPSKCLPVLRQLDKKLGSRWLSRALGAFLVFHSHRANPMKSER